MPRRTWRLDQFEGGVDRRPGTYSRDQNRFYNGFNVYIDEGRKVRRRPPCIKLDGVFDNTNCQGLIRIDNQFYTITRAGAQVNHTGAVSRELVTLEFDNPPYCEDWQLIDLKLEGSSIVAIIRHAFVHPDFPYMTYVHYWDNEPNKPTWSTDGHAPSNFAPSLARCTSLAGIDYERDYEPPLATGLEKVWIPTAEGDVAFSGTTLPRIFNQSELTDLTGVGEYDYRVLPDRQYEPTPSFIIYDDFDSITDPERYSTYFVEYWDPNTLEWTVLESGWSLTATEATNQPPGGYIADPGSIDYTSPGTYTFRGPAGYSRITLDLTGAGGGGGGSSSDQNFFRYYTRGGGGGGGGGRLQLIVDIEEGEELTIEVGAGGAGGSAGGFGSAPGGDGESGTVTRVLRGSEVLAELSGGSGGGGAPQTASAGAGGAGGTVSVPGTNVQVVSSTAGVGGSSGTYEDDGWVADSAPGGAGGSVGGGSGAGTSGVQTASGNAGSDGSATVTWSRVGGQNTGRSYANWGLLAFDSGLDADIDLIRFVRRLNPAVETTDNAWYEVRLEYLRTRAGAQDAGWLPCSNQRGYRDAVTGLVVVRSGLVVQDNDTTQFWQIDPNPDYHAFQDQVPIGAGGRRTAPVEFVGAVMVPTGKGFRAVSPGGLQNQNLRESNLGEAIDEVIE